MLTITVPAGKFRDEKNNDVVYSKETVLNLEHSLLAISKWESKYHKPYLKTELKTEAEARYYIKCMTINKVSDDKVYWALTAENIEAIDKYIHDPMTAVTFVEKEKEKSKDSKKNNKKKEKNINKYTSEYIYYLMISYGIPHEFEKWHIERLFALLHICREEAEKQNIKNENNKKEEKRTTVQQLDRMAALNERNKAALHTRG
jgi:hypothetical protein